MFLCSSYSLTAYTGSPDAHQALKRKHISGACPSLCVSACVQTNPTYIAQQQAFINTTLAASTATYNLVVVSSCGPPHLPGLLAISTCPLILRFWHQPA